MLLNSSSIFFQNISPTRTSPNSSLTYWYPPKRLDLGSICPCGCIQLALYEVLPGHGIILLSNLLWAPTQSCYTIQMSHLSLLGLTPAAFVFSLALPLGVPAKHILPFLGVPDMADYLLWPVMWRFLQSSLSLKKWLNSLWILYMTLRSNFLSNRINFSHWHKFSPCLQ